ncbi:MAG: glycosyltransferase family 87 protein [Acidobacteriaceae bacterium]
MAAMDAASSSKREKPRNDFADIAIVVACALAILSTALFLTVMSFDRHLAGGRDFVVYWATGQQLAHHANPFDPAAMGQLERAAGYSGKGSFFMRNPPWSLLLTLPLGYFSAPLAALPWSLLLLALLVLEVRVIWGVFGRPRAPLEWLGYCFPPALVCATMGQTSLFVLLGLVLFLRLYRIQPFWAGAALWFCTLKPHLFVPFGLVLLVWIVLGRHYRIIVGLVAALAVSCAATLAVDPAAFRQYLAWAQASGISQEFLPCIGVALRNWVNPQARWLAFVPCIIGCIWGLAWFWCKRAVWSWLDHGHLLMLVSILVAPYAFFYDQSLALPALLCAAVRTESRRLLAVLGLICILLEIQPLYAAGPETAAYLWTAPAWLAWYLLARHTEKAADAPVPSVAAAAAAP